MCGRRTDDMGSRHGIPDSSSRYTIILKLPGGLTRKRQYIVGLKLVVTVSEKCEKRLCLYTLGFSLSLSLSISIVGRWSRSNHPVEETFALPLGFLYTLPSTFLCVLVLVSRQKRPIHSQQIMALPILVIL